MNLCLCSSLSAWLLIAAAAAAENPGPISKSQFAPVPDHHPLASTWNDPEFVKRLIGSYGFSSEIEPRMTPAEQSIYRDKIVPLLRDDPRKAIRPLESLAKPGASAVFDFTLGNICFQSADLTNAVKYFESAIAKFPDFRRAHQNLGLLRVRDGKYPEAIESFTRAIELGAADGKLFGLLGYAYLNIGRHVSAEAAYRQALVFDPENADFKTALVKSAIATSNFDYALALLDELLDQFPERDLLWTLQSNIFIQREQPAKAAISLEIVRRLGKATPQNLFLLGDLYMTQEMRDLALSAYSEAIERDGGQNPARALRPAEILVNRGALDEAKSLFAKIRLHSASLTEAEELKLLKLESRAALATGEGEKAIQMVEKIIQKDPLDGEALLLSGDYYSRNGQLEKAEFRYDAASKVQGFAADAFLKHAQLKVQSRNYPQAIELLQKAQKLKPRDNVQKYLEKLEQVARQTRS